MPGLSILDCDIFTLANRMLDTCADTADLPDFSHYRNLQKIGEGGMGEVYVAQESHTGRRTALKLIRGGWTDPHLRQRFQREVNTLAQLEHPFIARLYESGVHPGGTPYFSMEFVEGTPLDEYCQRRNSSLKERIGLFYSLCEAVSYAHSRAVIHLDLKPSNILVKENGTPKLLDFGIARQLATIDPPASGTQTQVRFTPSFAAPEQVLGRPVGTFTDVYSLGLILYELLTGGRPYDLSNCTPGEVEAQLRDDRDPPRPSVAARQADISRSNWNDLDVLCLKALKKDVGLRYRSVVEMMQDVEHYQKGEPLKARPDSISYRISKFIRRNGREFALAGAIAIVIAILTGIYLLRLERARNAVLAQAKKTERVQQFMLSLFGDSDTGPPDDLRVIDLLATGVKKADLLKGEPDLQADLYQTLGGIYKHLGRLDRSDKLLRLALDRRRQLFGFDSVKVANTLVALSYLRIDQAQFGEAERLVRQALGIYRRQLTANDPAIARGLTALGSLLLHQGKLNDGIAVLADAVNIQSRLQGEQAGLIESLTYLANCHQQLGQNVIAYSLHRRILELDQQLYPQRHPQIAEDLSNLGESAAGLGKYQDAERYDRQALDIEQSWYGQNNAETGLTGVGLGKTLVLAGKYADGINVLQQALSTLEGTVGKSHPFVSVALQWLGVAALKTAQLDEAEAEFKRMAEIYRSSYGDDDGHQGLIALRFGELSLARKRCREAEALFRQAIKRFSKAFSVNGTRTGIARIHLGSTLIQEQRWAEAEGELVAGYKIVTQENNFTPDSVNEARMDLASVSRMKGAAEPPKTSR